MCVCVSGISQHTAVSWYHGTTPILWYHGTMILHPYHGATYIYTIYCGTMALHPPRYQGTLELQNDTDSVLTGRPLTCLPYPNTSASTPQAATSHKEYMYGHLPSPHIHMAAPLPLYPSQPIPNQDSLIAGCPPPTRPVPSPVHPPHCLVPWPLPKP